MNMVSRFALLISFMLLAGAWSQALAEGNSLSGPAGYVDSLDGEVYAQNGTDKRRLALEGAVYASDMIETKEGGAVRITFVDESVLELKENSRAELKQYLYDPEQDGEQSLVVGFLSGVLRLVTGEIVKKNPDRFKVETPLAIIGIRGTTIASEIKGEDEIHALLDGSPIIVTDKLGNFKKIDIPDHCIDVRPKRPLFNPRRLKAVEKKGMRRRIFLNKIKDERLRQLLKRRRADMRRKKMSLRRMGLPEPLIRREMMKERMRNKPPMNKPPLNQRPPRNQRPPLPENN